MKVSHVASFVLGLLTLALPACEKHDEHSPHEMHKIVATSPAVKDVVVTRQYVCQIHSRQYIEIFALSSGYLEPILVKEGQTVKKGEVLFKILPVIYKAKMDSAQAEVRLAELKLQQTEKLFKQTVVAEQDVLQHQAELAKMQANFMLAQAEFNFATIKAPFDGIIDRLLKQQGSLIKEKDVLTTLSDNSVMWVYFNVPEKRYLEYKSLQSETKDQSQLELVDSRVELQLADGNKFDQIASNVVTVEGKFNNETGNIAFRSDFPNPNYLLRHGQTGTILIHHTLHDAVVIPQRATFEVLDKRYAYVIGEDHVAHQRPITVQHEIEDVFVVGGLAVNDKIVLEGVQQVRDGDKLEYEFRKPEDALKDQKNRAE